MTGAFFCLLEVLHSNYLSVLLPWLLWIWIGETSTFEKSSSVSIRLGLWLLVTLMLTLVVSSFQLRAIMGSFLLMSLTSLSIWEAINLASHSFPALFKCKPCLVKYFLLNYISSNVTWLNNFAVLLSLVLNDWISRSCLWGIFANIILVLLHFCINWITITKVSFLLVLLLPISFVPPFITIASFLPRDKFHFLGVNHLVSTCIRFDEAAYLKFCV